MEQTAAVGVIETRKDVGAGMLGSLADICDNQCSSAFKQLIDLVFASLVAIVLLPIFPIICLLIKLDSPGPVLYRQKRVGRNNRIFMMYKFRTMVANAEKDTGPVWSRKGDPRITRVGRWLRKTYIDELPQFINILFGDMSLVGPRPERPELMSEFEELVPGFSRRTAAKPGITGLAQVRRLYKMVVPDIRHKLRYDLFYIKKQCCVLDLKIILKTVNFWIQSCLR